MQNPKISVVITSFNRFEYLLEAIESVQKQEYPNYEIIVINDDSDDERYYEYNFQDPIKIFHIKKSETPDWGGARNPLRNIGVEKSSGKYIAFLDDDDIWLEGKLKKQVALLENSEFKMSTTEGFYGEGRFNSSTKHLLYNKERWFKFIKKKYKKTNYLKNNAFPEIWSYDFLNIHNCIITSSVMVERDLFLQMGGFRGIPVAGDYDCWLGLLKLTSSIYLEEPLFYYDNSHGDGRNYSKFY